MLEAAMQTLASQFYYGVQLDTNKGFPGLISAYDTTDMVVDAGGTTASTGSSVWAVRWNNQDVQWIWGNNGSLELSDVSEQRILDALSNPFTAYVQEIFAHPGLQVASKWSVGRIKKITADATKTLTDALIATLLAKFPVGKMPDVLYMSRRSLAQLRAAQYGDQCHRATRPISHRSIRDPDPSNRRHRRYRIPDAVNTKANRPPFCFRRPAGTSANHTPRTRPAAFNKATTTPRPREPQPCQTYATPT